jgi:hypothetical protein
LGGPDHLLGEKVHLDHTGVGGHHHQAAARFAENGIRGEAGDRDLGLEMRMIRGDGRRSRGR